MTFGQFRACYLKISARPPDLARNLLPQIGSNGLHYSHDYLTVTNTPTLLPPGSDHLYVGTLAATSPFVSKTGRDAVGLPRPQCWSADLFSSCIPSTR